jgi:hypothetical protein
LRSSEYELKQIENGSKGKSVQVVEVIEVVVCWSQRMLLVVRLARLQGSRKQEYGDEQDEVEENGLIVS